MIYFLYGEMGVGKNYVGDKLSQSMGLDFLDGDSLLPTKLRQKVEAKKPLLLDDVEDYIKYYLIPHLRNIDRQIVVAQAMYRKEHRQLVSEMVPHHITWIQVVPKSFLNHIKQLWDRDGGLKWLVLMLLSKPYYQQGTDLTISSYEWVTAVDYINAQNSQSSGWAGWMK